MKHLHSFVPLAFAALALPVLLGSRQPIAAQAPKPADGGWISLFDGKSLDGWRGYKKPDVNGTRWRVENGTLTLPQDDGKDTRGARDIITTETFDLFDL